MIFLRFIFGFVLLAAFLGMTGCGRSAPQTLMPDAGGAGGGVPGVGGGVPGDGGGAGGEPGGSGFHPWAEWPMPNQRGQGLPNEHKYTVSNRLGEDVVRDDVTALTWQRALPDRLFTWTAANEYCRGLVLAGWDDWRLPSRVELVSLLDLSRTDPAIDLEAFPSTPGDWFWTSSRRFDNPANAWYVYFYFGYPDSDDQQNTFRARCVR